MACQTNVHIWPREIGAGVNERGNVLVTGMDREQGTTVTIEIHSAQWKHVLAQFGRLSGVGIVRPEGLHVVTDDDMQQQNTE